MAGHRRPAVRPDSSGRWAGLPGGSGCATLHCGESEQVLAAERPQGLFTRQLSLGEGVDSDNLTADYADGVLHVTIPVSPKTQARRVEITRVSGQPDHLGEHG